VQQPFPKKRSWRFLTPQKIWSAILAFCTLLGVVVLWPRVNVDVEKEPDFSSAIPNSITVLNTGSVTLRSAAVSFGLCRAVSDSGAMFAGRNPPTKCNGGALDGSVSHVSAWEGHTLVVDEKWTVTGSRGFMGFGSEKLRDGDVDYIVSFWAWPLPFFRHTVEFRFATRRQSNGSLIWVPFPVD
jgi:hypothetical protein